MGETAQQITTLVALYCTLCVLCMRHITFTLRDANAVYYALL